MVRKDKSGTGGRKAAEKAAPETSVKGKALELALEQHQIPFERASVGDRFVLEKLQQNNWWLGGETSGHIICLDKNTTGNGIVAALQVMRVMQKQQRSLRELTHELILFPQTMINVRVKRGSGRQIVNDKRVCDAVAQAEGQMGRSGRVVLRPSGTEPKVKLYMFACDPPVGDGDLQTSREELTQRLCKVETALRTFAGVQ